MRVGKDRKYLEYVISGIQSQHQARVDAANQWRDQEIEEARAWFTERGGSDRDFDSLSNKVTANGSTDQGATQVKTNGSGRRTIPMEVIKTFVHRVLSDLSVEDVTQTVVKDRLLVEYPDAKIPSIRSAIANELLDLKRTGYLVLVEEGRAGQPNKYRRTEKLLRVIENTEANLLDP